MVHLAGSAVVALSIAFALPITIVPGVEFQLLKFDATFIYNAEFHFDETLAVALDVAEFCGMLVIALVMSCGYSCSY